MKDYGVEVLLIDDEPDMLESFRRILTVTGHQVEVSTDSTRIREILAEHRPRVVLTDLRMPGLDGMEVLQATMEHDPRVPIIILTAHGSIDSAVQAVKAGAFDYLTKPIGREHLIDGIRRALAHSKKNEAAQVSPQSKGIDLPRVGMIGESPAMQAVYQLLKKVARTDTNILITGESGTGKEVAARCLHTASHRHAHPFIPIDCTALPETLLESELFGHEKGAFTGASAQKPGVFEMANGATVLLDEIGEMTPPLQAKMLRVIQERCFRRIGGLSEIHVDVRIISSTNRDLEQACEEGIFRSDLFFRLNVIALEMPPLREREGDIPLLSNHFFEHFMRTTDKRLSGISPEAMELLERHTWPGNVRELLNVIERAVVLSEGDRIESVDLPEGISGLSQSPSVTVPSQEEGTSAGFHEAKNSLISGFERKYLVDLLQRNGGNISGAAAGAGINRRTLYRLIHKFEIDLQALRS